MKGSDIALLAGVGIVGYGLLNSGFFKGLGKVGEGAGEAAEGLGSGISEAAQGLGSGVSQLSSQITSVTGDVAELTSFVGEFGNWTSQQIIELQENSKREQEQADLVDRRAFDVSQNQLADIQAGSDINTAQQSSLRSGRWETFKTDTQDDILDFFNPDGVNRSNSNIPKPTGLVSFNPISSLSNFVKNIVSKPSITGAVVGTSSTTSNTSSVRSSKSSGGSSSSSSSSSSISTTSRNKLLETLGYQGQSTTSGVVYTKPTFNFKSYLRSKGIKV